MKGWSNSEIPNAGSYIPEKKLLAAVMQRAITDYISTEGDIKESARIWLFEDEPTDCALTFAFICEALDLDVATLRVAIERQNGNSSQFVAEMAA